MKLTNLLFLSLLFSFNISATQILWTGNGDGSSWEDSANWDLTRVPIATDTVTINGSATVDISTSSAVAASIKMEDMAYLEVLKSGQLNIALGGNGIFMIDESSITNRGKIYIKNTTVDGIDMEDNSSILNYNLISLETIEDEGFDMDDDSSVENRGIIKIDGVNGNDGICMDDSDTRFDNYTQIEIKNVIENGEGIEVDDGIFTNHPTGEIEMSEVSGDILKLESGGEFNNQGRVSIHGGIVGSDSDNGIEIESSGMVVNSGYIEIILERDVDAIELESSTSVLNNLECGVIDILSPHQIMLVSTGSLTNAGVISTIYDGVNENNGTITNEAGAYILSPNGFMTAPNAVVNNGTIQGLCMGDTPRAGSTCEGGPCLAPIPTLSQWGIIVLMLLLSSFGILMIRQKKVILA